MMCQKPLSYTSSPSTRDGEGDRLQGGGGAPPSVAGATATSPSSFDRLRIDGEEQVSQKTTFLHTTESRIPNYAITVTVH